MTDLDGRVALVTGAASGIGQAIAGRLREAGAAVVTSDLRDADVEVDLTTREGNRAAVDGALAAHGRLDAVIPNAGFQHVAGVEEFPEERWDQLVALLLTSPFLLARYAWPALREAGDGRFIAVASAHGLVASPYKAAYVAAKHGVLGLMKVLALEDVILAPHAVKRLIEPEEVADAVLFCLSPAGRTITGAPLVMDQGWTAR